MGKPGNCGSGFNVVHTVLHQPVKDLDEGQDGEHGHEIDVELLAEDCHGQASLHDGLANPIVDALHLCLPQRSQEHLQRQHRVTNDVLFARTRQRSDSSESSSQVKVWKCLRTGLPW